jgi:hypothetical protein
MKVVLWAAGLIFLARQGRLEKQQIAGLAAS